MPPPTEDTSTILPLCRFCMLGSNALISHSGPMAFTCRCSHLPILTLHLFVWCTLAFHSTTYGCSMQPAQSASSIPGTSVLLGILSLVIPLVSLSATIEWGREKFKTLHHTAAHVNQAGRVRRQPAAGLDLVHDAL